MAEREFVTPETICMCCGAPADRLPARDKARLHREEADRLERRDEMLEQWEQDVLAEMPCQPNGQLPHPNGDRPAGVNVQAVWTPAQQRARERAYDSGLGEELLGFPGKML
jgi:hypothetical protein